APEARDRARAAMLHRDGLRALRPPRGQTADPDRAARLIEEAARLGDPDAQLLLAGSHLFRPDGGRDVAAAIPWLHRAAHQGQAEAQYRLARLLESGDGTPRDAGWAALWFHRAAERGHPEAAFAFAMLQVAGEGTARDEAEALARMGTAERRGVAAAGRYRRALAARVPAAEARGAF
ncbi:tetratricopeptide repeat protein, partial [Neoroseomonas rubea]|uniref:tetratricopeptide repeat protein n=1 Tax=Neoroseomonas rubea TaxID=2748666 RepID=UPI0018DEFB03